MGYKKGDWIYKHHLRHYFSCWLKTVGHLEISEALTSLSLRELSTVEKYISLSTVVYRGCSFKDFPKYRYSTPYSSGETNLIYLAKCINQLGLGELKHYLLYHTNNWRGQLSYLQLNPKKIEEFFRDFKELPRKIELNNYGYNLGDRERGI